MCKEKYICPDCSEDVDATLTCKICGDEVCFNCAYIIDGEVQCPACYMGIREEV